MFWHSAIKTDCGECAVPIGFYCSGWSFHDRRLRAHIIQSIFGRCCYHRGNNGGYIAGFGNAESHEYRIKIRSAS